MHNWLRDLAEQQLVGWARLPTGEPAVVHVKFPSQSTVGQLVAALRPLLQPAQEMRPLTPQPVRYAESQPTTKHTARPAENRTTAPPPLVLAVRSSSVTWQVFETQQPLLTCDILHGAQLALLPQQQTQQLQATQPAQTRVAQLSQTVVHTPAAAPRSPQHYLAAATGTVGLNDAAAAQPFTVVQRRVDPPTIKLPPQSDSAPYHTTAHTASEGVSSIPKIPVYGLFAPLLLAAIVFAVLRNPLLLLFALLTVLLLISNLLDGTRGARVQRRQQAAAHWQQTLLAQAQKNYTAAITQKIRLDTVCPPVVQQMLQTGASSFSALQQQQLRQQLWAASAPQLSPQMPAPTTLTLLTTAGLSSLATTTIIYGTKEQLMQACYSVLQQLTAQAPPRTLGISATSVTPEPVHALLTLLQAYQVRQQTWLVTLDFNSGVPGQVKAGAAPFINSAQLSAATQDSATLAAATAATTHAARQHTIYFSENPPPPELAGCAVAAVNIPQLTALQALAYASAIAPLRETYSDVTPQNPWLAAQLLQQLPDSGVIISRWQQQLPPAAALGPNCTIDLDEHGPHLLIAGTTGAGKSELLQSLMLSLAIKNSPQQLQFVLVDYKGGTSFGQLHRLTHVDSLITDLQPHNTKRLMRLLLSEITRRETVLQRSGHSSYSAHNNALAKSGQTTGKLSRLVIIIDEFATLLQDNPDAEAVIVKIAQLGRALGVHLILATQRPAGAISDRIRANIETSIALRTTSAAESHSIIASPAAATLTKTDLGACYLRNSSGLTLTRFYSVNTPIPANHLTVQVHKLVTDPVNVTTAAVSSLRQKSSKTQTTIATAVLAAITAAAAQQPATHTPIWIPALPPSIPAAAVCIAAHTEHLDTLQQGQLSATELPRITLLIGPAGSGKTSALAMLGYSHCEKMTQSNPPAPCKHKPVATRTHYLSARQHSRWELLRTLKHCTITAEHEPVLLLLDDCEANFAGDQHSDPPLHEALQTYLRQPHAKLIAATANLRWLPAALRHSSADTCYFGAADLPPEIPYRQQQEISAQLANIPGRALLLQQQKIVQFVKPKPKQLTALAANAPVPLDTATWAADLNSGAAVPLPKAGTMIISYTQQTQLQHVLRAITAELGHPLSALNAAHYTTLKDYSATQLSQSAEQLQLLELLQSCQPAQASSKQLPPLLLTAVQELSESATSALQQTIANTAAKRLLILPVLRSAGGGWALKNLCDTATTVLCLALQNTEAIPAPLLPHYDRNASCSANEGYYLHHGNCDFISLTRTEQ